MKNIGTGHFIFAIVFAVVFIAAIAWSYRKDLKKTGVHYRRVWIVIAAILIIYFTIFFLNRIT